MVTYTALVAPSGFARVEGRLDYCIDQCNLSYVRVQAAWLFCLDFHALGYRYLAPAVFSWRCPGQKANVQNSRLLESRRWR